MATKRNTNNSFTKNNDEENEVLKELTNKSKKREQANNAKNGSSLGFWIFSSLFILASVLIARSPLFRLNLDKPLKANYIELPTLIPFEGALKPNALLENAKYIAHKKLVGAETIVFAKDGTMYTGLMNGQIVKVDLAGDIHKIAQIGEETNEAICNDFGPDLHSHEKCGRPLGIRLNNDSSFLYVADSYHGIFKVNLATGQKHLIFGSKDARLGSAHMKLVNDLDMEGEVIYFIDSSYEREVNEAIEEHLEALPRGRLFSFNERTNKLDLLLENLYFPNGLQLTPNKDALLINENSMARILKYYLTGAKKGSREVFVELPGFGDTIRLSDKQTLMVPIAAARASKFTSLLDLTGKLPFIRHLFGYFLNMRQIFRVLPKYGLLVEYDMSGKMIKSWHDPTGKKIECITAATVHESKIYLGSFYIDYIGVVDY